MFQMESESDCSEVGHPELALQSNTRDRLRATFEGGTPMIEEPIPGIARDFKMATQIKIFRM